MKLHRHPSAPLAVAMFSLALLPLLAQAQAPLSCNQLGRELALRATEEGIGSLNADDRTALAQLAEAVCQDFQQAAPAASSTPVAPAAAAAPAQAPQAAAEPKRDLLGLDIIEPEDRVRRAALKRR